MGSDFFCTTARSRITGFFRILARLWYMGFWSRSARSSATVFFSSFDSLAPFGILAFAGSLGRIGLLIIDGSLLDFGVLFPCWLAHLIHGILRGVGSLLCVGFLRPIGSLLKSGFLSLYGYRSLIPGFFEILARLRNAGYLRFLAGA